LSARFPEVWTYARGNDDGSVYAEGACLVGTWWRPIARLTSATGMVLMTRFNGATMMSTPWSASL